MKKRILSIMIISTLIISTLGINTIQGQEENQEKLFLVSKNESDLAVATSVADKLDTKIVETEWGVYQNKTLKKILEETPDKVFVIGGTKAVPEKYENNLSDYGINVERITGEDRYETGINLIETLNITTNNATIIHGQDIATLEETQERKREIEGVIMVLSNKAKGDYQSNLNRVRNLLQQKNISEITIRGGPEFNPEQVKEDIEEEEAEIEEKSNETIKNQTESTLMQAEEIVENATRIAGNSTHPGIVNPLSNAQRFLEDANQSYNESHYGRAYGKSTAAINTAREVISKVEEIEEEEEKEEKGPANGIEERIEEYEDFLEDVEEYDVNQTKIQNLENQLNNATDLLEQGEIQESRQILNRSKKEIKSLYRDYKGEKDFEELEEEITELKEDLNDLNSEYNITSSETEEIESGIDEAEEFLINNQTKQAEQKIEAVEVMLENLEDQYEEENEEEEEDQGEGKKENEEDDNDEEKEDEDDEEENEGKGEGEQ